MKRHRSSPRPKVSKRPPTSNSKPGSSAKPKPTFDFDGTLDVLRDSVARADAMVVAADELIMQLWSGMVGNGGNLALTRRKNHVSYYLEAVREAVRAAMYAGDELDLHRSRA